MLVTVIADASYDPQTRAGGFGYWAVSERKRESGGGPFKSLSRNNNVAEMMAIMNGVHLAFVHGVALPGDAILAQTDCQAAILAFEGKRVLQPDETILVEGLKTLLELKGATVRFRHVKGHTSGKEPRLWVNNHCDALAKQGMREARDATRRQVLPELIEQPKPQKHRSVPGHRRAEREQDQRNRRTFAFDQQEWNRYVMDPELSSIPPWEEQELPEQPLARDGVGLSHAA
ncbi:ribonuclease HI [Paraburkholderia sp. RCC_158]|uniref:ribonuclease HI n=1 Tax=Paraburkholderia sp. RCC_158 TaxID=3239220 RepID=UPI003526B139